VNAWLKRCPAWQFVLVWDAAGVAGVLTGVILAQVFWRHHVDGGALAGAAAGALLASTIMGIAHRANLRYSRGTLRRR
jgi:hypothetical protein